MGRPCIGLEPAMPVEGRDLRPRRRVLKRARTHYPFTRHEYLECGHRLTVRRSEPLTQTRRCDLCPPGSPG